MSANGTAMAIEKVDGWQMILSCACWLSAGLRECRVVTRYGSRVLLADRATQ